MLNCASMIYFFRNMAICNFKLKLFDRMLYRDLDGYHCAGVPGVHWRTAVPEILNKRVPVSRGRARIIC